MTLLFKRLYSVDAESSLHFLHEACQRLHSAMSESRIHVGQVEAVLHLVLTAGETYRGIPLHLYEIFDRVIFFLNFFFRHF